VKNAGRERQLALLRAHPDLATHKMVAENMTDNSKKEQANYIQNQLIVLLFNLSFTFQSTAGLSNLTSAQMDEFTSLNKAYKDKFHFPFILALRDQQQQNSTTLVDTILDSFRNRMNNTDAEELDEGVQQIGRIAHFRLRDLVAQEEEDE
jgi:2-oxo-4-hydroxy-4-carboxy--5-ureidoimidazoline (OHCU) decarboxylase